MVKRAFFSFHYENDNWRAAQVRNIRNIDGSRPASDNDWESIKSGGDRAIQNWIDRQLHGKSTLVLLIGSQTAGRKWINYEIKKAFDSGKALVGVRIECLQNRFGQTSFRGNDPFQGFTVGVRPLSDYVVVVDPGHVDSKSAYRHIALHLESAIDRAKALRGI